MSDETYVNFKARSKIQLIRHEAVELPRQAYSTLKSASMPTSSSAVGPARKLKQIVTPVAGTQVDFGEITRIRPVHVLVLSINACFTEMN